MMKTAAAEEAQKAAGRAGTTPPARGPEAAVAEEYQAGAAARHRGGFGTLHRATSGQRAGGKGTRGIAAVTALKQRPVRGRSRPIRT